MGKGLMIFGIIGLAVAFMVMIFLLLTEAKKYSQTASPNSSQANSGPINEAKNSKAMADMQSVSAYLETYRSYYSNYPITYSFSAMSTELINKGMLENEPQEPEGNYHYLYCSDDGLSFNLTAEAGENTITQKGNSSCQPGE